MALKAFLTTEEYEGLDESARGSYREVSDEQRRAYNVAGGYIVDVEAVEGWDVDNTASLRSSYKKKKTRVDTLEQELSTIRDSIGEATPEELRDALKRLNDTRNWTPEEKVREKIDSEVKRVEDRLTEVINEKDTQLKEQVKTIDSLLIDSEVTRLMQTEELKGNATLLLPHVHKRVKVVVDKETGKRRVRVLEESGDGYKMTRRGGTGDMPLDEFIAECKDHPTLSRCFDEYVPEGLGSEVNGKRPAGDRIDPNLSAEEKLRQHYAST